MKDLGSSPEQKPKRPALVWLTQVLALLLSLVAAAGLVGALVALPRVVSAGVPAWGIALGLSIQSTLAFLPALLFYGLQVRRRWAWAASIAFAWLFLALVILSRVAKVQGPIRELPIAPEEMLGAAVAEVVVTVLLVLYPFRLYFSRKVRSFLGVPIEGTAPVG